MDSYHNCLDQVVVICKSIPIDTQPRLVATNLCSIGGDVYCARTAVQSYGQEQCAKEEKGQNEEPSPTPSTDASTTPTN